MWWRKALAVTASSRKRPSRTTSIDSIVLTGLAAWHSLARKAEKS